MSILELRQYTMVPGRRDEFADLFDREFVETQEALGIEVVGQFRDLDHENRYVWMRRFPDMPARRDALEAFYSGPVWAKHKDAANATMTEWHDVLLLRPAGQGLDLAVDHANRSRQEGRPSLPLFVLVWDVQEETRDAASAQVARELPEPRAVLVTDPSPNTYPRLPIREDASVVVAIVDGERAGYHIGSLGLPSQTLRLAPTRRSALRGL